MSTMTEQDNDTLAPKEVAAMLDYSLNHVYDLIRAGVIPGKRLGPRRKIYVRRCDIADRVPVSGE